MHQIRVNMKTVVYGVNKTRGSEEKSVVRGLGLVLFEEASTSCSAFSEAGDVISKPKS